MDLLSSQSELFSGVYDIIKRQRIKTALLWLDCVIPLIKTFHENCKYLSIEANIIKSLLLPTPYNNNIVDAMYSE
jgi:hypothetical protein